MVLSQSVSHDRFHERRPRRRSYPPQKNMEKAALLREGALRGSGPAKMLTHASPVFVPAAPAVQLEVAVSRPESDSSAVVSFIGGTLSVLTFILGFISGFFFYVAPVFALASAVLGIVSFSRIRSKPLELRGTRLAMAGAILGSIVLAVYLCWFGIYGLGEYVKAAHYPVL